MAYKNPADRLARSRRLIALGFKGGENHATYARSNESRKAWGKAHKPSIRAAQKRQTTKIRAMFGTDTPFHRWLYPRMRKDGRLKK